MTADNLSLYVGALAGIGKAMRLTAARLQKATGTQLLLRGKNGHTATVHHAISCLQATPLDH